MSEIGNKTVKRSEKMLRGMSQLGAPLVGSIGWLLIIGAVTGAIFMAMTDGRIDFVVGVALQWFAMSVLQIIWVAASV